jgi:DNA-binding GntR family transcriptional regulator
MPRIWQFWREQRRDETPEQAQQRQAEARAALADDYHLVFASPVGQRVLADILRRAEVMQSSFAADPMQTAFNEGRRRIGLEIIEMCNADPAAQQRMAQQGMTEELFPNV